MDKSCHSSGESNNSNSNNRDQYLKQLNKLSHKISKPCNPIIINKPNAFDHQNLHPQHQPPVYNINKNDFRDVVQKLTGSDRLSTPPPVQHPKPPSSRLHRIRPPPLAQLTNRPPPMISCAAPPNPSVTNFIHRPASPLSPLPPLPAVHAAAESPVSAYMRYLQNSADSNSKTPQFSGFSPLVLSRWTNSTDMSQQQGVIVPPSPQQQMPESQPQSQFPFPSSPLPFACLNSPRSPYPLLSPSLLFSPTSGQFNFPLSPTVPVPSPRWRGL